MNYLVFVYSFNKSMSSSSSFSFFNKSFAFSSYFLDKLFSSLFSSSFKSYLPYKTIFCHKVALDAQLMFLFEVKIMFCSRDI